MPKFRVRVICICEIMEEAFIEIEAEDKEAAENSAIELAENDDEGLLKFGKEWLQDSYYKATARLVKP